MLGDARRGSRVALRFEAKGGSAATSVGASRDRVRGYRLSVVDAAAVIAQLTAPTVSPADGKAAANHNDPSRQAGVPLKAGLYAWWMKPGVLPGVRGPVHPSERLELLYVGIAPSRPASKATLRSRVVAQHLGGNINTSTFRFSLAALLCDERRWQPVLSGTQPRLRREDDKQLSEWLGENVRLCWAEHPEPWLVEGAVITALAPPLNLADNASHPFHATVSQARAALRAKAVAVDTPRLPYQPTVGTYVVGYDIETTPITRNFAGRRRASVTCWLAAIHGAASAAAATVEWSTNWRYAVVIEIRIPWDADVDNFLKDILDKSEEGGVFAGDDKRVDLVHGIKRWGVTDAEAGARVEVWRIS